MAVAESAVRAEVVDIVDTALVAPDVAAAKGTGQTQKTVVVAGAVVRVAQLH